MKFSEMERIRLDDAIERLEGHIGGLRLALRHSLDGVPVGLEAGQAITQAAVEIATKLAKLDAYQRAEREALR